MARMVHCQRCAAITNGCTSSLLWETEDQTFNVEHTERLLTLNGWWRDHGEWVCGKHERPGELSFA